MHKQKLGFTIVELLIVIVVIAVLASISVVAYRGVQNRADDSAVQSDISNFAKKVLLHHAEHGDYPAGVNDSGTTSYAPAGMENFRLSRGSYDTSVSNFYYCRSSISGARVFAIGATSKSGNRYFYSSQHGNVQEYSGDWGVSTVLCPGMLPGAVSWSFSFGYRATGSVWQPWID